MKGQLRHKIVYQTLQIVMKPFLTRKFNYRFERIQPLKYPSFILPNHVTNWDPLLVGLSFPQMMYYVASDHLFRLGLVSRLIEFLVSPIPRVKSSTDRHTAAAIIRRIREGHNICIFPEGNMTFSGETGKLHRTTAKLIKHAKAALVTYRIKGGYLTQPRWSRFTRRGIMTGQPVRIYTPEEIESMSEDELMKCIENDLYTNAYEEQKSNPTAFRGRRIAEYLETTLYLCPVCSKMGNLNSRNDTFSCSCGLKLRYTEYGYLESLTEQSPPFTTVLGWTKWQTNRIRDLAEEYNKYPENKIITSDEQQSLWKIQKARISLLLAKGTLNLYSDRLVFQANNGKTYSFPLASISDMAIHGRQTLIFTTTGHEYYELKSRTPRSALKYYELYKALTGQHSIYES